MSKNAYNQISQSGIYSADEVSVSITCCGGSLGGGSEVLVVQNTTGTISPGGHPGSYNGQDAYNDMLVTDDGIMHGNRTSERRNHEGGVSDLDG